MKNLWDYPVHEQDKIFEWAGQILFALKEVTLWHRHLAFLWKVAGEKKPEPVSLEEKDGVFTAKFADGTQVTYRHNTAAVA